MPPIVPRIYEKRPLEKSHKMRFMSYITGLL